MLTPRREELQEDLFPDGQDAARRRRHRWTPLFPLTRWTISVSYEHVVLATVALVMSSLVLFSLGMERGKRLTAGTAMAPRTTASSNRGVAFADNHITRVPQPAMPAPSMTRAAAGTTPAPAMGKPPVTVAKEPAAATAPLPKGKYTIQLATFSQPPLAEQELRLLRKRGYQPFMLRTNQYAAVCVGTYVSRQEAAHQLAAFKSSYRDSFVRQR